MSPKKFGTLAGVFTPTALTILGVIMYIRLPWVVGNAGVLGALLIVSLSVAITLTTALSISSITTNVKIGAGGAFSVISQSLGLEIGGAIGIPFYFAQAIAVAMYVFGFREGLTLLFPDFSPLILDVLTFVTVMTIAFISTSFAFKIQYFILSIIFLSLLSIFGALFVNELNYNFTWFGSYKGSPENNFTGSNFWNVFAVFFPAVTGVMAGANMSGDLADPRKSIPAGTLWAVAITTVIYVALTFVASLIATDEELVSSYMVFIEKSIFPPIVLAGLLGATLSSAIGSFVGAPRILLALGEKQILPKSNFISKKSNKGEPVNAMLITTIVVIIGISFRNLNTIAPLLTMFFMITYAMVNVVALIEQFLGLPSYRPSLKIHLIIPLIGAFGSITVMFVINAFVAMVSIILIVSFYLYLVNKKLKSVASDSRSGLFTALAAWATKKTTQLSPKKEARSWRPDLLIPLRNASEIRTSFKLIESIVAPKGSIKILTLIGNEESKALEQYVPNVINKFNEIDIPISVTSLDSADFNKSLHISMQALNAAFFKPNTILSIVSSNENIIVYENLMSDVIKNNYGLLLYIPFNTASLAIEKNISIWITELPKNWSETYELGNNDLSFLTAMLIAKNWDGIITLNLVLCNLSEQEAIILMESIRLPKNSKYILHEKPLEEAISEEKNADLNIVSIPNGFEISQMLKLVSVSKISGLFCLDSGNENALV